MLRCLLLSFIITFSKYKFVMIWLINGFHGKFILLDIIFSHYSFKPLAAKCQNSKGQTFVSIIFYLSCLSYE